MHFLKGTDEKKRKQLLLIVAAGFVVGLFLMNIVKGALLEGTGLLSEYTLYEMKYAEIDSSAFFAYVFQKRVGAALILGVLSTTWLGLAVTWTCAGWIGISFGMLFMASLLQYGIKGILLIGVGIFPQVLVYFPVCILLLEWSSEFCMAMYFPHRLSGSFAGSDAVGKRVLMRKKALQFLGMLGVVIIGCVLESYVNPKLISNLLKIF